MTTTLLERLDELVSMSYWDTDRRFEAKQLLEELRPFIPNATTSGMTVKEWAKKTSQGEKLMPYDPNMYGPFRLTVLGPGVYEIIVDKKGIKQARLMT